MSSQQHIVDERTLHVTSVFQKTGDHAVLDHAADSDEEILVALGYKQEFKRDFSIWESFSVSFSVLGLLPSIASTLSYNLAYSGPAGSVWGWVVAAVLIQFVAFNGGVVLQYAHGWRSLLRICRSGTRRVGSIVFLGTDVHIPLLSVRC